MSEGEREVVIKVSSSKKSLQWTVLIHRNARNVWTNIIKSKENMPETDFFFWNENWSFDEVIRKF